MIVQLRHVGIVVRDLEVSCIFYQKLLGLTSYQVMDEQGPFIDAILGLNKGRVQTVKLPVPGGAVIELLYYHNPPNHESGARKINEVGITHFALTVKDIDQEYDRLKKEGVEFHSVPQNSPDGYAKVVFCKDPDGNCIELVEQNTRRS